jgi:L-aminopeptidase/D-esterase-like protein
MQLYNSITDVPGIEVGHAQDDDALTGCTVVICRQGAVAGVDVRGGAPGTRETDLLHPLNVVEQVNAIMLAGGSAFGLDAASGAMRYLSEQGLGFNAGPALVPIVPAAIIFDLGVGRSDVRPDSEMGYRACLAASSSPSPEGNIGAGAGASVGKILGPSHAMKSGIGAASIGLPGDLVVGALAVVNCLGDVLDPATGQIVAGARPIEEPSSGAPPGSFPGTQELLKSFLGGTLPGFSTRENTVLGVVAVNARLTKAQATKLAQMAQDGLARSIRPAHTMWDGDTVFALGTGEMQADISTLGAFAADALSLAILRAVRMSSAAGGLPGLYGAERRI